MVSKMRNRSFRGGFAARAFLAALALCPLAGNAQAASNGTAALTPALAASLSLPDDPGATRLFAAAGPSLASSSSADASAGEGMTPASTLPEASHTQKYIEPGQAVPTLSVGNKVGLGLKDSVSLLSAVGWVATAGYEQILNGSPNYGTDIGAFGQRVGAAAIRDATEDVFSDSVMSPIFREDPRYYRMGPSHNFLIRLVYSGTRPIIGRTDGGRTTPNFAGLAGNLAGSALASVYYPPINRGLTQTMETFGGSLGGSAVGDVVSEFFADAVHLFHPKQK